MGQSTGNRHQPINPQSMLELYQRHERYLQNELEIIREKIKAAEQKAEEQRRNAAPARSTADAQPGDDGSSSMAGFAVAAATGIPINISAGTALGMMVHSDSSRETSQSETSDSGSGTSDGGE